MFIAGNNKTPKDDTLIECVEVTINDAETEQGAELLARKIVTREVYNLRRVFECSTCFMQEETQRSFKKMAEKM